MHYRHHGEFGFSALAEDALPLRGKPHEFVKMGWGIKKPVLE